MSLRDEGIDIGLALAGLFGALLTMSKTAGLNTGRSVLATVGGAASANYVTPLILHVAKLDNDPSYSYAIAFLLGFAGLRGIEWVLNKVMTTDESTHAPKRRR
jgi:hypothetical protein